MLALQGAWIPSLVGELRSHKTQGQKKKKKITIHKVMLKSLNFPFSDLQDTLEVYSVFASFFRAPIITQL